MENKLIYFCLLLSVVSLIGVGFLISQSFNQEWEVATQYCTEKVTGQEWVKENCNFREEYQDLICSFVYQGQTFELPIGQIDIDKMESCVAYVWHKKVMIQTNSEIANI